MIKNHISFAGALALTFSMSAFAEDAPDVSQPLYDKPAYEQCVLQKLKEMHQEADEILARDPAEVETLIREYGHKIGFPEDFIDGQIADFRSLDAAGKHDRATLQLILSNNPSPTFACQNEVFGKPKTDAGPPLIMQ